MARNAASYFRSATMFAVSLLMVQVHVSTETTSVHLPACKLPGRKIMLLKCDVRIVLQVDSALIQLIDMAIIFLT